MLCSADLCLVTDISGQPTGPTFRGQAVQELGLLYPWSGTDGLSWNVSS